MRPVLRARNGAALLVALLVMLVLDCVVLGTMHLAVLERRLATNAVDVLRLRLAAEGGARESLEHWSPAVDTLAPGRQERLLTAVTSDGLAVHVDARRAGADAWLLRAEARLLRAEAHGRTHTAGRAAAALVVHPPALAPVLQPATAALTATGPVRVRAGAAIRAHAGPCDSGPVYALRVATSTSVMQDGAASIEGATTAITPDTDVPGHLPRLFALADSVHHTAVTITNDFEGTLLVSGKLTIAAGVSVGGFVVVDGDLTVETDALITGAVHVTGGTTVDGALVHDGCVADAAIVAARLRIPRAFPGRSWVPAF